MCTAMAQKTYNPTGPRIKVVMANGKSFVIQTDQKGSPKTTAHIVALVKKKFYDGQRIHRVVPNFVIQWGSPESRTKDLASEAVGNGGSGKDIPFEESKAEFVKGVVGIASTGMKVGGDSQLFVMIGDAPRLNGNYAVLGKVVSGLEVCESIKVGDKIKSITVITGKK